MTFKRTFLKRVETLVDKHRPQRVSTEDSSWSVNNICAGKIQAGSITTSKIEVWPIVQPIKENNIQ